MSDQWRYGGLYETEEQAERAKTRIVGAATDTRIRHRQFRYGGSTIHEYVLEYKTEEPCRSAK